RRLSGCCQPRSGKHSRLDQSWGWRGHQEMCVQQHSGAWFFSFDFNGFENDVCQTCPHYIRNGTKCHRSKLYNVPLQLMGPNGCIHRIKKKLRTSGRLSIGESKKKLRRHPATQAVYFGSTRRWSSGRPCEEKSAGR